MEGVPRGTARNEGRGFFTHMHLHQIPTYVDAARIKKKKNRGVDGERTQIQTPTKGGGGGGAPLKCDNQPTNQPPRDLF